MSARRRPFDGGGMSAAEMIESAASRLRDLGVPAGECQIVLTIDANGAVRRAVASNRLWSRRFAFGRHALVAKHVDALDVHQA